MVEKGTLNFATYNPIIREEYPQGAEMKIWRIASLSLIGLGLLYIISDLIYDFFGIGWFVLRIQLCPTMVYGLFCLTWGIIIWWKFGGKR